MYRIGVDVGGTNTDAVVMDGRAILAAIKVPTSRDVTTGLMSALREVLAQAGIDAASVGLVVVGTTHFTNAVIERRELMPTAVVRLCLPAAQCLLPMVDWPDDLRAAIGDHVYLAHGGVEFIYMLEGKVRYRHGGDSYELSPGDALLFDSSALHGPETLLEHPMRYLSIIIYPRQPA